MARANARIKKESLKYKGEGWLRVLPERVVWWSLRCDRNTCGRGLLFSLSLLSFSLLFQDRRASVAIDQIFFTASYYATFRLLSPNRLLFRLLPWLWGFLPLKPPSTLRTMPTFSAITLDMLLEPGASKSNQSLPPMPASNSSLLPNSKLERRNSTSVTERKVQRPQLKPSLYATPESTPLPDSPSSFPPSPYIINHKRRGPRLLKSFSEDDVSSRNKTLNEAKVDDNKVEPEVAKVNEDALAVSTSLNPIKHEHMNGNHDYCSSSDQIGSKAINGQHRKSIGEHESSKINEDHGSNDIDESSNAGNDSVKLVTSSSERVRDAEDFFDLHESMSFTSNTDGEDNGADHSGKLNTPAGEFFDAWEELSSEGGRQPSVRDIEGELREMRLSLLMEIEKRKQAEETLSNMQSQWDRFRQQLSSTGLTLHADSGFMAEGLQFNSDHVNDLCQQVYLARFVSDSIGRGIARAEMEMEMEALLDVKNFEIARLLDRLHYYEAVNHEMSQRNQESVEMARRERLRRKRRQKWAWGAVAAAITVGTAALAWSYLPSGGKSSSSLSSSSSSSQHMDDSAN